MIKKFAKVAVLNDAGQILLLRRSLTDERRPGKWDFPGGGVEPWESFAKGAARELREEAGIEARPNHLKLIYMATEYYQPRKESNNRVLYSYILKGDVTDRVTVSFEHDEFKWVSIEQALEDFPHPFYATALRYGLKHRLIVAKA